jgi:Holliday junction resolvasome RuvABC endonuclease subunit
MILGIDLGQHLGWVKGDPVGRFSHGTIEMPKSTILGQWLAGLDPHIPELLFGVTGIAIEQPFMGRDYYPIRKLIALLGYVHRHAELAGIRAIKEYPVATGKLTLSGRGNADAEQMIAAAAERGYPGLNEHEAHALGIWWIWQFGAAESRSRAARTSKGRSILNQGDPS